MSVPPPLQGDPEARAELLVRLEEPRGWGRRSAVPVGALRFSPAGLVVEHERALARPLVLPLAMLALASVDPGPARADDLTGRLPVLRRLSPTAVVPREDGVEGWLWTSRGGSAVPSLGAHDDAPNGVLLFTKPLAGETVTDSFAPAWVEALAARSPLGDPVVLGLLLRLADTTGARDVFERYRIALPLTDREVPPAMRRSLPTDISADVRLHATGEDPRAATSVAPPGVA